MIEQAKEHDQDLCVGALGFLVLLSSVRAATTGTDICQVILSTECRSKTAIPCGQAGAKVGFEKGGKKNGGPSVKTGRTLTLAFFGGP